MSAALCDIHPPPWKKIMIGSLAMHLSFDGIFEGRKSRAQVFLLGLIVLSFEATRWPSGFGWTL